MRYWLLFLCLLLPLVSFCKGETMPSSIQEIKKKHENQLLALPSVVSVGIGRDADGNPAIIVGLDGSQPEIEAQLPSSLENYPVLVEVVGPIKAL
jgi:hypothetical protein